jgi:hypothetical protein
VTVGEVAPSGGFAPVAVVWCRQVDNEAESPGYTTIPEEFPGRRETLETIRLVGNLTVNVADTHDYWDPDPSQTLSYYPNLFLYPAGNGRYTCVGRMFLSTEDRPRLGMKTLVLETAPLVASGAFGPSVLQAWASMGGRPGGDRPREEPDPAVFQAVGEGFLFHRGTTEPVVVVAAEQWEPSIDAAVELLRFLPTALIALGAFLIFPYFLPEGKVNLHEFAEQIPLSLAVMRVPEREAQGDRHTKRILTWEAAPVALRDLTRPPPPRTKDPLPLVLQYVRDHAEEKITEVSRRVDLVEATRLRAHLEDTDHQSGRDRRKEMWRIGTAMESAALLLARPKGRAIPMTGEAAKRANQYLAARPTPESAAIPIPDPILRGPEPLLAGASGANQLPPWLQPTPEVELPPAGPVAVPVSVTDDPSILPHGSVPPEPIPTPEAKAPANGSAIGHPAPSGVPAPPVAAAAAGLSLESEARLRAYVDQRYRDLQATIPPPPDPKSLESRLTALSLDLDARSKELLDRRLREITDAENRARAALHADLASRLAAVEARPVVPPNLPTDQVAEQVRRTLDPRFAELAERSRASSAAAADQAITLLRTELGRAVEELRLRATKGEEELRAALVAQMEVQVAEAKDQGTALREEIEGRVRELLKERLAELDPKRARELRDLEARLDLLVDGRVKDLESRLTTATTAARDTASAAGQEQLAQVERRLGLATEARVARAVEAQTQSLAGLQVRLQSYIDQRLREEKDTERDKYVELLARFKTEVDQALARTIDSDGFEVAVKEHVAQAMDALRAADLKMLDARVAGVASQLKSQQESGAARLEQIDGQLARREAAIADVEQSVRRDLEELDRRLSVLSERMVPLVRNTWLKVDELQKGAGLSAAAEAKLKEFRREYGRELRRLEGELLEQTTELRDRMEGAIAHQGRIWLNFVRQMAAADDDEDSPTSDAAARSLRRARGAASGASDRAALQRRGPFAQYDDPVNPLDPEADAEEPAEPEPTDRRRSKRTA